MIKSMFGLLIPHSVPGIDCWNLAAETETPVASVLLGILEICLCFSGFKARIFTFTLTFHGAGVDGDVLHYPYHGANRRDSLGTRGYDLRLRQGFGGTCRLHPGLLAPRPGTCAEAKPR